MNRTILAFLLSPLPAPALYYLSAVTIQKSGGELAFANFAMIYLIGLPFAYLAMLGVGLPLHRLATKRQWESIAWYLLGGALGGFAVWFLVSSLFQLGYSPVALACLSAVGAVSGAVFFLILRSPGSAQGTRQAT